MNKFFVETMGDCDHLSPKEKTMLSMYSHALRDDKFSPEDVETLRGILKEYGDLTELLGKKILRQHLRNSIITADPESIQSFEATALIDKINQELHDWDRECEELSLTDEESEDEKLEFFADNYLENILNEGRDEINEALDMLVEGNPSILDANLLPCEVKHTSGREVTHSKEYVIQLWDDPESANIVLTEDDLVSMLSILKENKPA